MMLAVVRLQWWTTFGTGEVKQTTYASCGGHQIFKKKYEHTIHTLAKEAVRRTPGHGP